MTFLNVGQQHGNGLNEETSEAVQRVFFAALLLTGSAARAERAIREGIAEMGMDKVSGEAVLHATVRAAIAPRVSRRRERFGRQDLTSSSLPRELRRVLLLPMDLRHCFVLRLLVGLPLSECSRLLRTEVRQVERNTVSAAVALASIRKQEEAGSAGSSVLNLARDAAVVN